MASCWQQQQGWRDVAAISPSSLGIALNAGNVLRPFRTAECEWSGTASLKLASTLTELSSTHWQARLRCWEGTAHTHVDRWKNDLLSIWLPAITFINRKSGNYERVPLVRPDLYCFSVRVKREAARRFVLGLVQILWFKRTEPCDVFGQRCRTKPRLLRRTESVQESWGKASSFTSSRNSLRSLNFMFALPLPGPWYEVSATVLKALKSTTAYT